MSKTIRVNREELLRVLESVQPGLSPRELVEQSSHFAFQNGRVVTYNEEVACHATSPLGKKFTGAVQAQPLLAIVRKLGADTLEVELGDELVMTGKNGEKTGLILEKEVTLPFDTVEQPGEWRKLPDEFVEAIDIVKACAGKDENFFHLTCVHVHPKWIEATDNYQICRWRMKTGFTERALVKASAVKHVAGLGMTEVSETEAWLHFRNALGVVLSCRRYTDVEEFPDLTPHLKVEGETITLPKGLAVAAEKAQVFTAENLNDNQALVRLREGKVTIKGQGVTGWYRKTYKVGYSGPDLDFLIAPQILADIVKRHPDCVVNKDALKAGTDKYSYVSCLEEPEVKKEA